MHTNTHMWVHIDVHSYIHVDSVICTNYDLDLRSPNDVGILKPKVGLRLDQIEINLRKVFSEKYNFFMN